MHLAINRVQPETERGWDPNYDYARVGLREVPGHHFLLVGHDPPDRADALTTSQLRKWERTGDIPLTSSEKRSRATSWKPTSWEDLEQRLADHGLRLQPRGRGLVVTDGAEVVKASSITRGASRNKLEQGMESCTPITERAESASPTASRRERLKQDSEQLTRHHDA